MNWLLPDPQTNYAPLDLSAVAARLTALEQSFSAVAQAKQGLDHSFSSVDSPQQRALLADLRAEADQAVARHTADIQDGFRQLLATAQANRQQAARDFAASPDGAQYLQGLAAFGTVAAHMPPDAVAAKLHSLIDAGLTGQARALAEVAAYTDDGSPQRATVSAAVQRAQREARTAAELTTDAEAAYIQNAADTFQAWTATIPSRLEDSINTGTDSYGVGTFDPSAILGTSAE